MYIWASTWDKPFLSVSITGKVIFNQTKPLSFIQTFIVETDNNNFDIITSDVFRITSECLNPKVYNFGKSI